jgi:hypothetical protein
MPPRDEEARFEQVLGRHLRRGRTDAACPDAETLAAYHERALTAEEMDARKGHIAACVRCQEALAGLEVSERITAGEKGEAGVAMLAASPAAMRKPEAMPVVGRVRARPMRIWKWMAPAAAVAAGILVWVAVGQRPRARGGTTTVVVNKQPAEESRVSREFEGQAASQSADRPARALEKQAQPALPAAAPPTSLGRARKEADELSAPMNAAADEKLDQKMARNKAEQYDRAGHRDSRVSTLTGQQAGMESGKKEAGQVVTENVPAAPSEYRREQSAATEKAREAVQEEPQKQAGADKDTVGVAAGAAPEAKTVGVLNRRSKEKLQLAKPETAPQAAAMLRDSGAFYANAGVVVSTPEKGVLWRVGAAGVILKTADGGSSWTRQASGVSVELLAGSAPSPRVCWIVGREGMILRTRDGEHWERIASPTESDLIGVEARDELTATVWTSQKLPKFVTRDGGKTWQSTRANDQP